MTYQQAYLDGKKYLQEAGTDSPAFDALQLFSHCFFMDRQGLAIHGAQEAPATELARYRDLIRQRGEGRPLQYLLGEWEFMGLPFSVGEGVLIPREDTEVVVRECARRLSGIKRPVVLDLCAGSGAVGIGLCSLLPGAQVTAVELSDQAYGYLVENIRRNQMEDRVTPIRGDILRDFSLVSNHTLDAGASNPPYIPSGDLTGLQREVQREPRMALDGGMDGLDFYRALTRRWSIKLKPGGVMAVEIGIHQAEAVSELFHQAGFQGVRIIPDLAGIPRTVSGLYPG